MLSTAAVWLLLGLGLRPEPLPAAEGPITNPPGPTASCVLKPVSRPRREPTAPDPPPAPAATAAELLLPGQNSPGAGACLAAAVRAPAVGHIAPLLAPAPSTPTTAVGQSTTREWWTHTHTYGTRQPFGNLTGCNAVAAIQSEGRAAQAELMHVCAVPPHLQRGAPAAAAQVQHSRWPALLRGLPGLAVLPAGCCSTHRCCCWAESAGVARSRMPCSHTCCQCLPPPLMTPGQPQVQRAGWPLAGLVLAALWCC